MPTLPAGGGALTLARFDHSLRRDAASCDLSKLTFIDAYGLVATACALLASIKAGNRPPVESPVQRQVRTHLALMGFGTWLEPRLCTVRGCAVPGWNRGLHVLAPTLKTRMTRLVPASHSGSREQAQELVTGLASDLTGRSVLLDSSCATPASSTPTLLPNERAHCSNGRPRIGRLRIGFASRPARPDRRSPLGLGSRPGAANGPTTAVPKGSRAGTSGDYGTTACQDRDRRS